MNGSQSQILSFVAVATARPQVYGPPSHPQVFEHHSSSFRVPIRSQAPVEVSIQPSLGYTLPTQNLGSFNQAPQTFVQRTYQAPQQVQQVHHVSQSYGAPQQQTQQFVSSGPSFVSSGPSSSFVSSGPSNFVSTSNFAPSTGGNFVSNAPTQSFVSHSSGPAFSSAPAKTIVTKDVYVHEAPEDPEEHITHTINTPQVNQKHYKILFIKAPSANLKSTIRVQQPGQNEEKTIVYVLVKKPEVNTQILQQEAAAAPQHKPEVYFIKYKNPKKAGNVVGDAPVVGQSHGTTGSGTSLGGIEHAGGIYPEEKRTRKSPSSPYGPANYSPAAPLG
ncbi:uncharacterized protein LOC134833272 [Culicoides brevitarsis]|uniref:uncharacterized protein LOC134833272 n=1 Tax=Culicoides brevitarsis TaxID=469753 RepID=UPI00307B7A97